MGRKTLTQSINTSELINHILVLVPIFLLLRNHSLLKVREMLQLCITAENMEKSQHTDFNEDITNESASVACSNVRL